MRVVLKCRDKYYQHYRIRINKLEYAKHKTVGIAQLLVYDNTELTDNTDLLFTISTINNSEAMQIIFDALKNTGLNAELRNTIVDII